MQLDAFTKCDLQHFSANTILLVFEALVCKWFKDRGLVDKLSTNPQNATKWTKSDKTHMYYKTTLQNFHSKWLLTHEVHFKKDEHIYPHIVVCFGREALSSIWTMLDYSSSIPSFDRLSLFDLLAWNALNEVALENKEKDLKTTIVFVWAARLLTVWLPNPRQNLVPKQAAGPVLTFLSSLFCRTSKDQVWNRWNRVKSH